MSNYTYELVRNAPKNMTEQQTVDYYLSNAVQIIPQDSGFDKPCRYVNVAHDKHDYTIVKRPIDSNNTQLHRMICNVNTKGGIKQGNHARHYICNTPWCVESSHLLEGTPLENMQDKVAAGTDGKDSRNPRAILTEPDVIEIRRLRASTNWTYKELGEKYGVHPYTIAQIITRKTWKHILFEDEDEDEVEDWY